MQTVSSTTDIIIAAAAAAAAAGISHCHDTYMILNPLSRDEYNSAWSVATPLDQ